MLVSRPARMALTRVACTAVLIRFPAQMGSVAFSVASHSARGEHSERARTYAECSDSTGKFSVPSKSSKLADTVPKRQHIGLSNGALGDSAGGCVRSCAERKPRSTNNHMSQGSTRAASSARSALFPPPFYGGLCVCGGRSVCANAALLWPAPLLVCGYVPIARIRGRGGVFFLVCCVLCVI